MKIETISEDPEQTGKQKPGNSKHRKINALSLVAWGIIVFGAIVAAYLIYGLIIDDFLRGAWADMSEAQGAVLASLITVYAAAIAGVVGPAILGAKFKDLDEKVEKLSERMNAAAVDVEDLTQSTRSSMHTLTELLQRNAGISPTYDDSSLAEKDDILKTIQSKAASFAQAALENSNKWGTTKDKFRGKWPSRQTYIELLWSYGVITDADYDRFAKIVRSRELIGDNKTTDAVTLNDLQDTLDKLGEKYDYS